MLVLSVKVGEAVTIGDGISVTLTRIQGKRARLGIVAAERQRIERVADVSSLAGVHGEQAGGAPRQ